MANLNIYGFLRISGHPLANCMGKTDIVFTVGLCERF